MAILRQIKDARAKVLPLIEKAAKLGGDGSTPEATTILMNDVRPIEQRWRAAVEALIALEQQRNATAYQQATQRHGVASVVLIAVCAGAIGLGALLAWLLTRNLVIPVTQAIEATERIAEGNLSTPIVTNRSDELGRLLSAVKKMQEQLRSLVGAIDDSASSISTASSEIATGTLDLSQRTEMQAASLQKTASNMSTLTATVKHNAESARQADHMATMASDVAARGGAVVDQVVSTMAEISSSSRQIGDIIGVIDSIAFQTNILALNAAVEAARAGEQGRGFAVVAAEVRSLAQRSADAAKQIKALVQVSGARVDSGVALVETAGATMREVVESVHRVTIIMSEITASTLEQSEGIGQIGNELHYLDQMTQQNAALVEESSAATENLRGQAALLKESVGVFRLGDMLVNQ